MPQNIKTFQYLRTLLLWIARHLRSFTFSNPSSIAYGWINHRTTKATCIVQSEENTLLRIINICDTSWKLQKWSYAMNTNYVPQCCFIWSLYTLYSTYTTTTVQHPKNIMPHAYGYGRGPAVCLIYVAKKLFYGLFGSCLARSTYIHTYLQCNTNTMCRFRIKYIGCFHLIPNFGFTKSKILFFQILNSRSELYMTHSASHYEVIRWIDLDFVLIYT